MEWWRTHGAPPALAADVISRLGVPAPVH
jgi:hypothetical protein